MEVEICRIWHVLLLAFRTIIDKHFQRKESVRLAQNEVNLPSYIKFREDISRPGGSDKLSDTQCSADVLGSECVLDKSTATNAQK